ncbi:peptide ABC transporter ATP-binding protein [Brevibacillus choshinensis]|uniref:Peptide ABC transporter ATP-binding protein n=1 Tax=Brevibacillus choshinensis TaxID=54911 RepID=A0ABR5N5T9_BRECH|nr:ABC transporter ATP-binding protein [Brevibacillus choshinensis]KQL45971.1 peptide ABC transporter ATP-binding protein [Brevibacillus choshinensis]
MKPILEIDSLEVVLKTKQRTIHAVNDVTFHVNQGETVGLVGESGSGKSITCRSILQLLPTPQGKVVKGSIRFAGTDLLSYSKKQMQQVRGKEIGMVLQDPMSSLDPVYRVGDQLVETFRTHQKLSKKDAWNKAVELLRLVGIPSPEKRVYDYPHQMSGGMRQRVMIALAICCDPQLLLADEPTTALDVTVQDQVLGLMKDIQQRLGMGILIVTHNLGVVAEMCDRVVVLYAGKVMETATTAELFQSPRHAYTLGLIRSVPRIESDEKLEGIPGTLPDMSQAVEGCPFRERCFFATEECSRNEHTQLREVATGHLSACFHHERVCAQA